MQDLVLVKCVIVEMLAQKVVVLIVLGRAFGF